METMNRLKQENGTKALSICLALCIFFQSIGINVALAGETNSSTRANSQVSTQIGEIAGLVSSTSEVNDEKNKEIALMPDGGPDQPEVQSFTPIGTSDMVDPFTGDFSYNIPLMDVDGYPLNLAYSAGVTMDQEATWVGLGWNLNPGVVNRNMRGIPDDFNGKDKILKEFNQAKSWRAGVSGGVALETFAFDFIGLTAKLGVNYSNYNGFGAEVSIAPSFSLGGNVKADLGFSGSSQNGASLSPSLSFTGKEKSNPDKGTSVTNGINIGSSFNSRGGVSNMSVGYSRSFKGKGYKAATATKAEVNKSSSGSQGASSSFNTGMATYTPQITMPMSSFSFTGTFKLGGDAIGIDGTGLFSGYYSAQWLKFKSKVEPAYGYMNLQKGQNNFYAMMDFNRENDGVFTKNTPALPIPNLTYDLYSISGQGVSGSYRPYRNDIGYVFDPKMSSSSSDASVGAEIGLGATFKAGIDVSGVHTESKSEAWNSNFNQASSKMKYTSKELLFREANELSVDSDPNHFEKIGGDEAVRFSNSNFTSLSNILVDRWGNIMPTSNSYLKQGAEKRNQVLYTLTNGELKQEMGIQSLHSNAYSQGTDAYDHHLGQFTVLKEDGSRYVYGIAAYSHMQKNVSFAVGSSATNPGTEGDCSTGLVSYSANDASINNSRGLDNHYNAVTTPAFAHSYLLTTVLNIDYIDADNIKGPSKGDLGGYLNFEYTKLNDYKWRNPVNANKAYFDEGLNSDRNDDKGHYIYGEKELWYVSKIISKNHIAIFYTSNRDDAKSVNNESGGIGSLSMQQLDSIALFSLPDFELNGTNAIPLKVVHFEYDYSLCQGYDQNTISGGKLTLKSVYFTYQNSRKGKYSAYNFDYNSSRNYNYNMKSVDRWGNFKAKPLCSGINSIETDPLSPSDFPYVGYDRTSVDNWVAAWSLSTIHLPSGGRIEVEYESDDYGYVQHKRASQMFRIIGVHGQSGDVQNISADNGSENRTLYFEMIPGSVISDYGAAGDEIYFRALMKFDDQKYDYVPGYCNIQFIGNGTYNGNPCGKIILNPAKLKDNGPGIYNPISVAAIQFGRLHLSRMLPPSNQGDVDGTVQFLDIATSIIGAFTSFQELFTGPNVPLWNEQVGTNLVANKSWLRLKNPNGKKLGGGHRVKKIEMFDAWSELSGVGAVVSYGQEYTYELDNGRSSGVASYEPQLGGDENSWRTPVANNVAYKLAPDARNYQETPFGEQFFPGPSVGYSKVTIKNLQHDNVIRTATGKVVHEFYTSKDYPTIVKRTAPNIKRLNLPIMAIFFSLSIDEMSASQGFSIENNDMHGKPKSQSVYAEGQNEPISKVEYFYQDEGMVVDGIPCRHLVNTVTSITPNGQVSSSTIGRSYEAVADFRKSTSTMNSGSVNLNLNYTLPLVLVPMVLGSGALERTAFRSASFTKIIERKGILKATKATDLTSEVSTNNLAYDSETGAVLLTQTTTDFNDKVYNFTYPAHWYYDGMGQAYKNIGYTKSGTIGFSSGATTAITNKHCSVGDEVVMSLPGGLKLGWVTEATSSAIRVLLKDGTPVNGTATFLKVLRSGRKNIQNTSIGSIALKENPLTSFPSNIFEGVLQAGVIEYSDDWRTFCECFLDEENENATTNPYVLALKGNWRPKASYVHLSDRTQTFENNNSNIREDGTFTSFNPFYELNGGNWSINKENWTYTSSVTEFSPFGQALETIDALDRYSSSMFGYNQSLPTAVAANTRYRQLGFDGFEDYDYINCSDNHFKIGANAELVGNEAHTGRNSLKVTAGNPVVFSTVIVDDCEELDCMYAEEVRSGYMVNGQMYVVWTYNILLGTAPFSFDLEEISGEISIVNTNTTIEVTYLNDGVNPVHYILTLSDTLGCTKTFEFKNF